MANISREGARRLKTLVDRAERAPRSRQSGRGRYPSMPGGIYAVRIGEDDIAPATSTEQWSSGVGYIREFDDDGAATSTEIEITLWNIETTATLLAGKKGLAAEVCGKIVFIFEIGVCT